MGVTPPATDRVKEFIESHSNNKMITEKDLIMLSAISIERDSFSLQNSELSEAIDKANEQILEQNKLMLQNKFVAYQEKINMLLDIIHFMTVKPEPNDNRRKPV